jgi:hypothetical protein
MSIVLAPTLMKVRKLLRMHSYRVPVAANIAARERGAVDATARVSAS